MYIEDEMTKDRIFAEALMQIIYNQMYLKRHLDIVDSLLDCDEDREIIDMLKNIN